MKTKPAGVCTSAIAAGLRAAAPRLRKDATRNRELILTAARDLIAVEGANVPLDEIAKRAGVGNATLYRNFPDRAALLRQVALRVLSRVRERAQQALEDEGDPFEAIRDYVLAATDERIGALCALVTEHLELRGDDELFAIKVELEQVVEQLLNRAMVAGAVRPDIGPGDLFTALARLTRPLPGLDSLEEGVFVQRHLHLFLDGLRAPAPSVLPGRPVTLEDLRRHMPDPPT
ncbi:TetR/AcrR family transcriptional regulator [Kitasatospora sp. LaBMicrA B282]|uniref:TetR/AcrR family transcriptional regulator n=1 Tax=Kitasatospora sp. LaBMicrA B282 TaxID=3420949 RepID=UPI003D0FE09C